ncbi:Broad-Complex, Tramtrack and Bric a brac [Branchiostoma belcheri]|nr:Broad-Complex, Tramtrack and Bric a brac [Branchiostoma belcheri]
MAHSKNSTHEFHDQSILVRSYQDESYLRGFLGVVGDLQKEGELQDVVLEVEGRRFPCHRLVLSAASPYFRAMFTSDMAESRQKTVVLQGFDAGVFAEILSYIYSGTLQLSLDRVQPLYQAADLLQLDYVRDTCSSYMAMNVERSTCLDLYKFADVFSLDIVRKHCLQCIHRNFDEVSSSEEFCSLSVDQLTEIISQDKLEVKEETRVWEAVVRWVQHSREDRLHYLPSILPHIRSNLLTSDDTAAILEHPLVREEPGSAEVIKNVVKEASNLKPRLGMTTEMFLLITLISKSFRKNEVHYMNPQQGKHITCRYEDLPHITDVAVTSDNDIYALTSEPEDDEQVSLSKYNHADNVWEQVGTSSVSKVPSHYKEFLIEVKGIFFYIGTDVACRRDGALVEVRKYNQHTDQWQECSHLEHYKEFEEEDEDYGTVLSCGPYIYFITNDDMYRYDPSLDCWHAWTPPKLIPDVCTAVTMGTEIFCTNFFFTDTMLYDTELDYWQRLQGWPNPANLAIHNFFTRPTLFLLENQVHILVPCDVGQEQEEHRHLVFVYDRSDDVWREKVTLPDADYSVLGSGSACPVTRFYLPYLDVQQDKDT